MRLQGFPRWLRLRRRREFLRVQRSGEKHHMRHFLVFVTPTPRTSERGVGAISPASSSGDEQRSVSESPEPGTLSRPSRLGVTVTKKVGGAVVRNRIKRLVREAYRRHRHRFADGLDMVWVAKHGAAEATLDEVVSDMETLAQRLRTRRGRMPGSRPNPGGGGSGGGVERRSGSPS